MGCLILKPLAKALHDGDTIRAVIRGTGSNQDGRTAGIALPNRVAQENLIRSVYRRTGLDPAETDFVEAHGTGTQAGDPLETKAISEVFGARRSADNPVRIGSIKTNVGHLEGASGVAGVIKAIFMLENRVFLPNRNFERINPHILLDQWNIKVWRLALTEVQQLMLEDSTIYRGLADNRASQSLRQQLRLWRKQRPCNT